VVHRADKNSAIEELQIPIDVATSGHMTSFLWIPQQNAQESGGCPEMSIVIRMSAPQLYASLRADGRSSVLSHRTEMPHPMRYPVWIKPALWGAVCGAVAITFLGFSALGWKTSQAADNMAQEQADAAAVTALVPFCVAKAEQPSEQTALAKVRTETSAFSRSDLVMQAGWATVGASKAPDNALAIACADRLRMAKPGT
jgi:hypothetical protein